MYEFMKMLKAHLKQMEKKERLAYLVRFLWHSTYSWGHEIIGATDCSGTVCFALYLMGYNIRTTADGIFNNLTIPRALLVPGPGDLVFWKDAAGKKVVHVAVFSDDGVLMNAGPEIVDRTWKSMTTDRARDGQTRYDARALDFAACQKASEDGTMVWGVDPELEPLFGLFEED